MFAHYHLPGLFEFICSKGPFGYKNSSFGIIIEQCPTGSIFLILSL